MYLRPGMKIKLKNEFLDSFHPFKNSDGLMDIYCGKVVTIRYIEEDDDRIEFHIKEEPRWYFGTDYIDYIVNDTQMDIE